MVIFRPRQRKLCPNEPLVRSPILCLESPESHFVLSLASGYRIERNTVQVSSEGGNTHGQSVGELFLGIPIRTLSNLVLIVVGSQKEVFCDAVLYLVAFV